MDEFVRGMTAEDFIPKLEDQSVPLILTDPPYYEIVPEKWDRQWEDEKHFANWLSDLFLAVLPKLTPNGSLVFFGAMGRHRSHPIFRIVSNLEDGGYTFRQWITWKKRRAFGKQIALTTEIPTPRGFVPLLNLKVGDEIFDENGDRCKILKLHPIDLSPESYRVRFDDGTTVDACRDHLWWTQTRNDRVKNKPPTVKTTKEIFLTLRHGKESNHSVPTCGAVDYETKPQTIDPYLLGIWLGDGSSDTGAITTADPEVLKGVEHSLIPCSTNKKSKALLYRCLGLTTQLRELGLLRNKHIPRAYLQGDRGQRLSLLQGLMDSDGHCSFTGNVEFCNMNETLAHQVKELMLSLGMKANLSKGEAKLRGVSHGTKFRVGCVTSLPVFRLARKLERITSNSGKVQNSKRSTRYIVDVQPIPPTPMRCITVDSFNGLFLVSRNFVPTHNSHDYIYIREEILWFSKNPERTAVTFNKPYLDELRGYGAFDPKYSISDYKRAGNVWTDIAPEDLNDPVIEDITELFKLDRQCQKPVKLMDRLIKTHSNPGDLVVDLFSGWGTTGIAAVQAGRRFLGCEKIKEDAVKANQRVVDAVPQGGVLDLF